MPERKPLQRAHSDDILSQHSQLGERAELVIWAGQDAMRPADVERQAALAVGP